MSTYVLFDYEKAEAPVPDFTGTGKVTCDAFDPETGYECTMPSGHEGPHVAGDGAHVLLVWIDASPRRFTTTVTIEAVTAAQAHRVLGERLLHDEDYGFDYSINYGDVQEDY